jgi:hypothetical protein
VVTRYALRSGVKARGCPEILGDVHEIMIFFFDRLWLRSGRVKTYGELERVLKMGGEERPVARLSEEEIMSRVTKWTGYLLQNWVPGVSGL